MNRYARLLLQLCRVRVAHSDVAQSGSIEKLRRRRVTFIEHRLNREISACSRRPPQSEVTTTSL